MRREPLLWLAAFVAFAGASAACAMVAGLGQYSTGDLGTLDASNPAKDGSTTPPATDAASDTGDDAEPESGGSDAGAEDAMGDAPEDDAGEENDGGVPSDGGTVAEAGAGDGGKGVDAGDGGKGVDAGDGGSGVDAGDGGCMLYTHFNGTGQVYTDCAPLDTYNSDEAMAACEAADLGACAANTAICVGGPTVICTQSANPCRCWSYSGGTQGHVNTSALGVLCGCPAATDPDWF